VNRTSLVAILAALLASCAPFRVDQGVLSEIENATAQKAGQPDAVREALLPPLRAEIPKVPGRPWSRASISFVNAAPARQVFLSIVSGTRYSMIVNPAVSGTLSLNLKDVTVREALEAVREVYGYEFRIDGNPHLCRIGRIADPRIPGELPDRPAFGPQRRAGEFPARSRAPHRGRGAPTPAGAAASGTPGRVPTGVGRVRPEFHSDRLLGREPRSMVSQSDFWNEITFALSGADRHGAGSKSGGQPAVRRRCHPCDARGAAQCPRSTSRRCASRSSAR